MHLSYSNGEKDRYVCRPSRQKRVHGGFDWRKQAVNMVDDFGIEKAWVAIYEGSRQHGNFWFQKKKRDTEYSWGGFICEK